MLQVVISRDTLKITLFWADDDSIFFGRAKLEECKKIKRFCTLMKKNLAKK